MEEALQAAVETEAFLTAEKQRVPTKLAEVWRRLRRVWMSVWKTRKLQIALRR
jgi:hypothetical protein